MIFDTFLKKDGKIVNIGVRQKIIWKIIKGITCVIGVIAIFFGFVGKFISKTYDSVEIEQIISTMGRFTPEQGDTSITQSALMYILAALFCSFLWCIIQFKVEKIICILVNLLEKRALPKFTRLFRRISCEHLSVFMLSIAVAGMLFSFSYIDKCIHFSDWLEAQDNDGIDFYEEHYHVPDISEIKFDKRKNLFIVLNESLETTFASTEIEGGSLLKGVVAHTKNAQKVDNFIAVTYMNYTAGAVTAWSFGIPLNISIDGDYDYLRRGYLPNAVSIFDVLKENGYKMVLIIGSDKEFAGQDVLFETHGNFEIKDKDYWIKQGFSLEKYKTKWGFSDSFVFERACEEYQRLQEEGEPFVLFVETIDLHMPNGWCPPELVKYGDLRDAVLQNDRVLSTFLDKVKTTLNDNTVLAVVGDHNFMGRPSFIEGIDRKVFNAFWGNGLKIPNNKCTEVCTAVDIAPTLLQMAGGTWDNDQFGLGISMLSDKPSLAERLGIEEFNKGLRIRSERYKEFY